jgi:adenosylcobinamide-GDP ribazoletransferase
MKDSRLGGFGSIGLILLLLVKFAALQGVLGKPHATFALVGVVAVARWAAVAGAFWFKSARPGGMGDYFRTGLTRSVLVAATVLGLTAAAALLWRESVVWAAVLAAFLAFAFFARSRLGGLTGDVYGGIIELAETAALTVLCFV